MKKLIGKSIFEGIVIGKPFVRRKYIENIQKLNISEDEIPNELKRFETALKEAKAELKELKVSLKGKVKNEDLKILNVHLMIMDDPVMISEINNKILEKHYNSEKAIQKIIQKYVEMFGDLKQPVYKQRAIDIQDVGEKLIAHLTNEKERLDLVHNRILIAKDILPSELLKFQHLNIKLKGLILEYSGSTSHVAILAKALEIPTIMGVRNATKADWGEEAILDSRIDDPCIICDVDRDTYNNYIDKKSNFDRENEISEYESNLVPMTKDNIRVNLELNIGGDLDLMNISKAKADGIGLFRTEFLYMDSEFFPIEEAQIEVYEKAYEKLKCGNPLVIRTLDIGADKQLTYYEMPEEENPFLGLRGIRFTLTHLDIFKTQLRAVLRAAHGKHIKLMYPMITNLNEFEEAEKLLEEAKRELEEEGLPYKKDIEVGIMIEVPSTIFLLDAFSKKVDFISIGTNDLTQYIMAVDRLNENLSDLYDSYDPALIRALFLISEKAKKYNIPIGVCGEMAGERMGAIIFLALGIKKLSMQSSYVPKIKRLIRKIEYRNLSELKEQILYSKDSNEVKKYIRTYMESVK